MVKSVSSQSAPPAPQKAIFARLSYLYQAATLLSAPQSKHTPATSTDDVILSGKHQTLQTPEPQPLATSPPLGQTLQTLTSKPEPTSPSLSTTLPISRFLLSSLLSTSRKSVLRLSPSIKRTICKRCSSLLIPTLSANTRLENNSRNGRKEIADVLCIECVKCGAVRRYPVGEERVKKDRSGGRASQEEGEVEGEGITVTKKKKGRRASRRGADKFRKLQKEHENEVENIKESAQSKDSHNSQEMELDKIIV